MKLIKKQQDSKPAAVLCLMFWFCWFSKFIRFCCCFLVGYFKDCGLQFWEVMGAFGIRD